MPCENGEELPEVGAHKSSLLCSGTMRCSGLYLS
jgi:hypothetical protein